MRPSAQKRIVVCGLWMGLALMGCGEAARAQESAKHAMTFDDLISMRRVAEAELSPDGKWVVYTVATPDMEANRNATNLWMAPTAAGETIQLTRTGKDSSPKWSPDGKTIAFLSSRSGDSQVYLLSMEGGEAHPLTKLSAGSAILERSPQRRAAALRSRLYPACKDAAG